MSPEPLHEQKPSKDSVSLPALRVPNSVLFGCLIEVLQKDPDRDEFRFPRHLALMKQYFVINLCG